MKHPTTRRRDRLATHGMTHLPIRAGKRRWTPGRSWLAPLLALAIGLTSGSAASPAAARSDLDHSYDPRVRDLLSRMTPEEKFWQLFMLAGEFSGDEDRFRDGLFGLQVPADIDTAGLVRRMNEIQRHFVEETRLGIPVLFFAEALHGLVQRDATIFPQAIGLAATFDTTLMGEVGRATAEECRARGIRQVLSPVVNIASDVRWGRVEETYGEDPFLSSEMGVAFVSAFERAGVITTPKHWIANVGDGGRDSYPIELNERAIREIRAFKILTGVRGNPPSDAAAIEDTLLRLSTMVCDHPEISELDINPLIVHPEGKGCSVADSRIMLRATDERGGCGQARG